MLTFWNFFLVHILIISRKINTRSDRSRIMYPFKVYFCVKSVKIWLQFNSYTFLNNIETQKLFHKSVTDEITALFCDTEYLSRGCTSLLLNALPPPPPPFS